jgi:hypothetical protein
MGMCALYEGCALPALVGSTLVGSWLNTAASSTSKFTDACDPREPNWVVASIAHAIISLCSMTD